jgi:acyl-CoA thioesterase I
LLRPLLWTSLCLLGLAACVPQSTAPTGDAGHKKPLVYVAIGASDAVGVGAGGPDESWVGDLARRLPPGSRLVNLGISGEQLHGALVDELPVAVDADPDLVTIWLAVNDLNARVAPESYEQDLDTMLGTLQRQTHARVAIGNIPDLSLVPAYGGIDPAALAQEVNRWNAIIARQAALHGATVVDIHASWTDLAAHPEYVGVDGFHPSAEGYQRLADLFYATLQANGLV